MPKIAIDIYIQCSIPMFPPIITQADFSGKAHQHNISLDFACSKQFFSSLELGRIAWLGIISLAYYFLAHIVDVAVLFSDKILLLRGQMTTCFDFLRKNMVLLSETRRSLSLLFIECQAMLQVDNSMYRFSLLKFQENLAMIVWWLVLCVVKFQENFPEFHFEILILLLFFFLLQSFHLHIYQVYFFFQIYQFFSDFFGLFPYICIVFLKFFISIIYVHLLYSYIHSSLCVTN